MNLTKRSRPVTVDIFATKHCESYSAVLTIGKIGSVILMIIRSFLCACILLAGGCAAERAIVAQDAQTKMVGLSKEQVLACMGTPTSKAAEGQTEVWTYIPGTAKPQRSRSPKQQHL